MIKYDIRRNFMLDIKSVITKGILTTMAVVSVGAASLGTVKANNSEDKIF